MNGFQGAVIIAIAFLVGFVVRNELTKPPFSMPFDFEEFVRQLVAVAIGAGAAFVLARSFLKGSDE